MPETASSIIRGGCGCSPLRSSEEQCRRRPRAGDRTDGGEHGRDFSSHDKVRVLSPGAQLTVDPASGARSIIRDICAEGAYRFHWSVIPSEESLPIASGAPEGWRPRSVAEPALRACRIACGHRGAGGVRTRRSSADPAERMRARGPPDLRQLPCGRRAIDEDETPSCRHRLWPWAVGLLVVGESWNYQCAADRLAQAHSTVKFAVVSGERRQNLLRYALELAFLVVSGNPEQDRRRPRIDISL